MLWDAGSWEPQEGVDVDEGLRNGKLAFLLHGKRLQGKMGAGAPARTQARGDKDNWLLIKELDDYVRRDGKLITERETTSVKSGRAMEEIAAGRRQKGLAFEKPAKPKATAPIRSLSRGPAAKKAKARKPKRAKAKSVKKNAALPAFVAPQLATLVDEPPPGRDWLHEIKYDGYRVIAAHRGRRGRAVHAQRARLDRSVSRRW